MRRFGSRLLAGLVAGSLVLVALRAEAGGAGLPAPAAQRLPAKASSKAGAPSGQPKAGGTRAQPKVGSELQGTWEVTRVLADLHDQPHWGIRPGDASLLYRSMTISWDKIWFVGDSESCDQASWQPLDITWQALFQKSGITRTPSNTSPARATPADYDLKVSPRQRTRAFLVCPAAKQSGSKAWYDAGWMALEGPDSLVVRYSQQLLVVLRRRAPGEKPQASFACDKASTPTEKAICSDVELAAWDRSVAEALRQVLEYRTEADERARILKEHVAWKKERDQCGADAACLSSAFSSRVMLLSQE